MKTPDFKLLKILSRKLRNYVVVFFIFLLLSVLAFIWILNKTSQTQLQIEKLKQASLVDIESVDHQTVVTLAEKTPILASFLPDEFNLYHVIALIEQIGVKTRFNIESYSLKYVEVKPESLERQSLELIGSGTFDQFMAFLKEYKFITGKLLTIDSVNLSGDKRVLTNLSINIYAFKPEINIENQKIPALDQIDKQILDKVEQFYVVSKQLPQETQYKLKTNPFE